PVLRLTAMPIDGSPVGDPTGTPDVALTPDGQRIAYTTGQSVATLQLFVRSLDQLAALPLKGLGSPSGPFLSPDGQWVGYLRRPSKCPQEGRDHGGATGDDLLDHCVSRCQLGIRRHHFFSSGFALLLVHEEGGTPEVVAKPDGAKGELAYAIPDILPGNRVVLFTISPASNPIDNGRIAVRDLKTGQTKVLVQGGNNARYAPSGHLVYAVTG